MKRISFFLVFGIVLNTFLTGPLNAQERRSSQAPFIHGVASGDPMGDRVIIWTRLTTDSVNTDVSWQVATDVDFNNVVNQGVVTATAATDYTIKVDVTGLSPNTVYYYEFDHKGYKSVIGRTMTLPSVSTNGLRLALMSCTDYQQGYFNVYARAAERNDFDYVLHVGDYIYEYKYRTPTGNSDALLVERMLDPDHEIKSLSDYRRRYAHFRLEEPLQNLHQQHGWFITWDDHEFANDAHMTGAAAHQPADGSWDDRVAAALQAFHEWMPIRTDFSDLKKVYGTTSFGDLVDLIFIETRVNGRTRQPNGILTVEDVNIANGWQADKESRSMLGTTQLNWLKNELSNSTAKWKVMVSSIPFSPFNQSAKTGHSELKYSPDLWDGNPLERSKIADHIVDESIGNFVVLTGDRHSGWAWDIPLNSDIEYEPDGTGSIGVEFACSGVTARGAAYSFPGQKFKDVMPYLKYANPQDQGYTVVTFTQSKVQSDYFIVPDVKTINTGHEYDATVYSLDGANHLLTDITTPYVTDKAYPPLAPAFPRSGIVGANFHEQNEVIDFNISPNPASNENVLIQFSLSSQLNKLDLKLYDVEGKVVHSMLNFGTNVGYNQVTLATKQLPTAIYILSLEQEGNTLISKKLQIK